jgi:hypothetical protein
MNEMTKYYIVDPTEDVKKDLAKYFESYSQELSERWRTRKPEPEPVLGKTLEELFEEDKETL